MHLAEVSVLNVECTTEMCGLRTRPRADADPQNFLDPRTDSGSCGHKLLRTRTDADPGDKIFILYNWALNFEINFQRAFAAKFTNIYDALAISTIEIYNKFLVLPTLTLDCEYLMGAELWG
jgi:hypothetical protein